MAQQQQSSGGGADNSLAPVWITVLLMIALFSRLQHQGNALQWLFIAAITLVICFCIAKAPANKRKLVAPTGMNIEINIEDYYYLENICRAFPEVASQVKDLLKRNGHITFQDFEKIWIEFRYLQGLCSTPYASNGW